MAGDLRERNTLKNEGLAPSCIARQPGPNKEQGEVTEKSVRQSTAKMTEIDPILTIYFLPLADAQEVKGRENLGNCSEFRGAQRDSYGISQEVLGVLWQEKAHKL